jgi:hypothetical protein
MRCAEFGHHRPCFNPDRFKIKPPEFQHWRYVRDGRLFSADKLRMTPQELQALGKLRDRPLTTSWQAN